MPHLLLGRYRVLEERGHGGFGTVSVCWDPRLMRRVAIKVIPLHAQARAASAGLTFKGKAPNAAANTSDAAASTPAPISSPPTSADSDSARRTDAMMRAALAETRTASMLAHPNIVAMLDFEADSDYAYIIMEYVEGASLAELLDSTEDGLLTFDEAAAIAEGVGDALQYAHENGVLHLDIKPDNILIDGSGRVRLADFGMASLSSATGYSGAVGGTVGYMPPEQILGTNVDVRTDVFAFAAVMYEALTGVRPFAADTAQESLDLVCSVLADPCALNESINPLAADALLAALSPDPDERPDDIATFVSQLRMGLGSPRIGRKSLANFVADVTNDEQDALDGDGDEAGDTKNVGDSLGGQNKTVRRPTAVMAHSATSNAAGDDGVYPPLTSIDDELGALARIFPHLASRLLRIVGAVACGFLAYLVTLCITSTSAGASATSITAGVLAGAIGLVVPQLASAIVLVGLVAACCLQHFWVGAILVAIVGSVWWSVCARHVPLTSGIPLLSGVDAVATSSVTSPIPSLLCGYLLSPGKAALSALTGFVICLTLATLAGSSTFNALDITNLGLASSISTDNTWTTLVALVENPSTLLNGLSWVASASIFSALAHHGSYTRCYLGCFCSLAILLGAKAVEVRVENAGVWTAIPAEVIAGVIASFILICAIVFLFGTPRSLFAGARAIADDEDFAREDL